MNTRSEYMIISRAFPAGPIMETSQIKQSIVDLTERTDALRRYL